MTLQLRNLGTFLLVVKWLTDYIIIIIVKTLS